MLYWLLAFCVSFGTAMIISPLQAENVNLKKQLGLLEEDSSKPEHDVEQIRLENSRLKAQIEQARKVCMDRVDSDKQKLLCHRSTDT